MIADHFGPGMVFWIYWTHDHLLIKRDVCVVIPLWCACGIPISVIMPFRYMHRCEFSLEIDGAVALQFTAADLCGLTSKGLLHPFVPPFNEIAGPKDDMYVAKLCYSFW